MCIKVTHFKLFLKIETDYKQVIIKQNVHTERPNNHKIHIASILSMKDRKVVKQKYLN